MNTRNIIDAAICNRSGRNGVDFYQECGQPTPLVFSCNTGNLEAVKILTVLGSRLHFAWSKGCCGNCSSLVEDWVNGRDCLHLAAERGFVEIAKYIWPLYKDKMVHVDDVKKFSCLKCQNSVNENLWTPLQISSKNGHLEMVKFLVEKGANTSRRTGEGKTPKELAKEENHEDIVEYLNL